MKISPAFPKNNVAVAFAINNKYVPILGVVLSSLTEHASPNYNYDILVLHYDITPENQLRLKKQCEVSKNFSLRFINTEPYRAEFSKLWTHGHFAMETWFRLLLPDLLPQYQKILYLDSDIVIVDDVATLFATEVSGELLAATRDADTAGLYNGYDPNKKEYMDKTLNLRHPYDYFQAGVILFNLEEFRKQYTVKEMLGFASSRKWQLLDQDVLNCLAQGKVKFVDMAWNTIYDWDRIRQKWIIKLAPDSIKEDYARARKAPKIIHYAGPDKPWDEPTVDYGEYFWQYAKETDFYDELKSRVPSQKSRRIKKAKKQLRKIGHKVFPRKIKY